MYGVFPVSCIVKMDISLDNPGFQVDVAEVEIHQADVPKSSSGESARRSCAKCRGRMSSFSLDRHLFCAKCRGSECSLKLILDVMNIYRGPRRWKVMSN